MRTVTVLMPFRRPAHEVSEQEQRMVHTWEEDREVPETVVEGLRLLLQEEEQLGLAPAPVSVSYE